MKTLTGINVGVLALNVLVTMQAPTEILVRAPQTQHRGEAKTRHPQSHRAAPKNADRLVVTRKDRSESDSAPREMRVKLTERQIEGLLEDIYRQDRLWRRTSGVLHALNRLQERGALPEIGESDRKRIVSLLRAYVRRRVPLERAVMSAGVSRMQILREDLAAFDQREIEEIKTSLNAFLDAGVAARIARVIVPQTP